MRPPTWRAAAFALCLLAGSLRAQNPLTIVNTSFPPGNVGVSYTQSLQATGGSPSYTWSATGQLPPGLSVNPSGVLLGTPTAGGTYNFLLTVADSKQATASKSFTLVIAGTGAKLTVATTALPSGGVGVAYSQTLVANGGTPPYTWAAGTGFPSSLNLDPNTGVVSGTPTTAGNFTFTVQVTDSARATATGTVSLAITPSPLVITTVPPIFGGTVGVAYTQTFRAAGGTTPYTWSIISGSIGELTLDAGTGTLQGTPQTAGTSNFTIQVADAGGRTASQAFSLVVSPPTLGITITSTLPPGTVGVSYNQRIPVTATGGTPPYNFAVAVGSSLPPGLLYTPSTVTLSGVPTAAGTFTFTMEVRDAAGAVASRAIGITIDSQSLALAGSRQLPDGTLNQPYQATVSASGGQPPYRWTAAGLPGGLSLNATTGLISGTPTAAGDFGVAITVTDAALKSVSDRFGLTVKLPPPPTATIAGLPATAGPAQQFPLQIALTGPFAAPITGQAILTFAPDSGPTDRTVQFASGGTTASFNVATGSTAIDVPIAVQTGTVAGTITVTLRMQAGGIDITASPAPTITTQIARAAPVIRSVSVNRSGSTLNVVVTGYSTAREITQAVFAFNAASGQTLQQSASSITVDVNTAFGNWFQDPNNSQFGTVFIYTQPFTVTGDVNAVIPTTVTLTNRIGSATANVPQ